MFQKLALSAVLFVSFVPMVSAQGVVTRGPLEFEFNADIAGPTSGNADLRLSGTDQLFQYWYWYRIAGDAAETAFPVPDTQDYTGSVATLTWADVDARGFSAELVVEVFDCTVPGDCITVNPGASLEASLTLTNNATAAPIDIQVFTYMDFDVNGSAGGDSAAIGNVFGESIGIDDTTHVDVLTFSRDFQVLPFSDVRDLLEDADADDLDGSGLPFGPADFTVAMQEPEVIPAAESRTVTETVFIETGFILFNDGFESGDVGGWSSSVP